MSLHSLLHLRAIYPDLHDITVLQHDSGDSASNQRSRMIFTSVGIAVGLKAEKIPHGWIVGRDNTMWLECGWADDEIDRHWGRCLTAYLSFRTTRSCLFMAAARICQLYAFVSHEGQ